MGGQLAVVVHRNTLNCTAAKKNRRISPSWRRRRRRKNKKKEEDKKKKKRKKNKEEEERKKKKKKEEERKEEEERKKKRRRRRKKEEEKDSRFRHFRRLKIEFWDFSHLIWMLVGFWAFLNFGVKGIRTLFLNLCGCSMFLSVRLFESEEIRQFHKFIFVPTELWGFPDFFLKQKELLLFSWVYPDCSMILMLLVGAGALGPTK